MKLQDGTDLSTRGGSQGYVRSACFNTPWTNPLSLHSSLLSMICHRCKGIPLDLFLDNRSIQYELHPSLTDFHRSASFGCQSCQILWQQRTSGLESLSYPPHHGIDDEGDSYWIEWDNHENRLVLASGLNHYFLHYDSETGLRTTGSA